MNLIEDWLTNNLMPSQINQKYTEVDCGSLGRYYEQGRFLEGDFFESWDEIEGFYNRLSDDDWQIIKADAIALISQMRDIGLDQVIRAGQSWLYLVLSRARRNKLELDHGRVSIEFLGGGQMILKPFFRL